MTELFASLFFSGLNWLWPATALVGAALVLVFWSYRGTPAPSVLRTTCSVLKLLGILLLGLCLLEPLWSGQRAKPGANVFVILADNSQGMQIRDRGETKSRGDVLRENLGGKPDDWTAKLEAGFQVRRYIFDSRVQPTKDFSELNFDGRATALDAALRQVTERLQGQPVAGILLMSDGNATDVTGEPSDLRGLPPVYPVVIGRDDAIKDISIQKTTVSQTAFEDAPVTIQADVVAAGYAGERVTARLLDASGKRVGEHTLDVKRDDTPVAFRFELRPEKPGLSFYRLQVGAQKEIDSTNDLSRIAEATLANNQRVLTVDRGREPRRILYVSGRPNWEFKFLNRALSEEEQVQLVGLIRIAKREPKFQFRSREGESSNPLFRGFGNQSKEEIEQYDKPVLVRLNTKDEFELRGGFPKTVEDLYAYQAIIVDDLEAEFFTRDQMMMVQRFVSERGGGFLMLGGVESFQRGAYQRTPIGDILPIYLDRGAESGPVSELKMDLTREGWLAPWTRLRSTEAEEKKRLESMVPFQSLNVVRDSDKKPGASVLATVTDQNNKSHPALVVQRFGLGRSAALLLGDFWHGVLHDDGIHRDRDKAWRQLVRWMVADVPNRFDLQVTPVKNDPNQALQIQVRARDKKFLPLDNAIVRLTVQTMTNLSSKATNVVNLTAEPSLTEPGLYEAVFIPRDAGAYRAEATVLDPNGAEAGRAEAGWTADPAAEEFKSLKPNRALMETIARQSGGEVIALNRLDEFVRGLPDRKAPVTENWSFPLWHTPIIFLLALACFIAEWGLRRWKGLA